MPLSALAPEFSTMLGIFPGFRKISIGIFQHRILIAMPELLLKPDISREIMVLRFGCALRGVLIGIHFQHESTFHMNGCVF